MTGTHPVAARPTAAYLPALFAATLLAAAAPPARADGDAAAEGVFVTVANPITSEVTNRVKERVDRAVREHKVRKVVFDFNPDGREAATPDLGPCSDLADFILDRPQLTTVAFVHNKVSRHTVLPVLACKELVMSREASILLPDSSMPLKSLSWRSESSARWPATLASLAPGLLIAKAVNSAAAWSYSPSS